MVILHTLVVAFLLEDFLLMLPEQPIGVHPECQGQGIGKAMLASFLKVVDEQGMPAYLEADVDRNIALYKKFGFKVIARADIAGVENRFMWRHGSSQRGSEAARGEEP